MNEAFGITHGGAPDRGQKMPRFIAPKPLEPFISSDLAAGIMTPIRFTPPHGGNPVLGFPASVLPDICNVWLTARQEGTLSGRLLATAQKAEILTRGLAHVGIIALIDEATGYQQDRARDALAKILEAFIAKELQPWVRTFPPEYYEQLFRLRGLDYPRDTVRRPQYFGVLTNDIVYKRLAPGVLDELKRINPKNDSGNRTHRYFQHLTRNLGYPKLREHLGAVVATMKLSEHYSDFIGKLDRICPRQDNRPEQLAFAYDEEADTGQGL